MHQFSNGTLGTLRTRHPFGMELAGVAQPSGDASDRFEQCQLELGVLPVAGPPTAQQVDLEKTHWIDVWVAESDRVLQRPLTVEQVTFSAQAEHDVAGPVEGGPDAGKQALADLAGELRVGCGNVHVGLGENHADVAEHGAEECPPFGHRAQDLFTMGTDGRFEAGADAVPPRQEVAVLHSGGDPGDGSQVVDPAAGAP